MKMPDWWYGNSLPLIGEFSDASTTVGDFWMFCSVMWVGISLLIIGVGILGFDMAEGRQIVRVGSLAIPLALFGPIAVGIAAVVAVVAFVALLVGAIILAWKEKI